MKTFIVISDSHGRRRPLERLYDRIAENDYCIHLGDGASDMVQLKREFPQKIISLRGNCDFSGGEEEQVFDIEGVKFLACHGHRYGVKRDLSILAAHATSLGCSLALYGHTHIAAIDAVNGITLVNPGALETYDRPTYCYLVIAKGKAVPTIVEI